MLKFLIIVVLSLFSLENALVANRLVDASFESQTPMSESAEAEEIICLSESTHSRIKKKTSNERTASTNVSSFRHSTTTHRYFSPITSHATLRILASRNGLGFAILV